MTCQRRINARKHWYSEIQHKMGPFKGKLFRFQLYGESHQCGGDSGQQNCVKSIYGIQPAFRTLTCLNINKLLFNLCSLCVCVYIYIFNASLQYHLNPDCIYVHKAKKKKIYNVQMKVEHFSQSTDLSLDYRENITSQTEQQIPPLSSQSLQEDRSSIVS